MYSYSQAKTVTDLLIGMYYIMALEEMNYLSELQY